MDIKTILKELRFALDHHFIFIDGRLVGSPEATQLILEYMASRLVGMEKTK